MSNLFRKMHMLENHAGGVDLMLAKDSSGEFIRILMGDSKAAMLSILDIQILCARVKNKDQHCTMPCGRKSVRAVANMAGGYDLVIDRDSGNPVMIHAGRQWRRFWDHLEALANDAEEEIEYIQRCKQVNTPFEEFAMSKYVYLAFDKFNAVHVFAQCRAAINFAMGNLQGCDMSQTGLIDDLVRNCDLGMTAYPDKGNKVVRVVKVQVRK